jgi:hypothetical protein
MWASTVVNVNSPGPMPVGLIVTNAVDALISSIRIFRNKEFLINWIQALYVPDRQDLRSDVLAAYAVACLR